jgi:DNA repair protein RadC
MPISDRPRERLQYYGPEALQTAELLAIILRTADLEAQRRDGDREARALARTQR